MKKVYYLFIFTLLSLAALIGGCSKKTAHYELSRFIPPDFCGACHGEI